MGKKFYQLEQTGNVADLYIYGDITSYPWDKSDVSASNIVEELKRVKADTINVYISSYGGEVQTGIAIYNTLKRQKAKVRTYCDGFAASIASVIFMAGEERIMNDASALMIHNAWTDCAGNAAELRKQADDLDKITQLSIKAYKSRSTLTEDEIKSMMNAETWILPEEAIEYGFATSIEKTATKSASQSAKFRVLDIIKAYREELTEDKPEDEETEEIDDTEETEETTESETEEEETETETEEEPAEAVDDVPEDEETADEEEPADGEEEENTEDEEEAENGEEENEEPAQYWSGFFNALLT